MKLEQIDIELQTIITVKAIGGGVHLTPSMVLDALEADGYELGINEIIAVNNYVAKVRAAALEIMWRM